MYKATGAHRVNLLQVSDYNIQKYCLRRELSRQLPPIVRLIKVLLQLKVLETIVSLRLKCIYRIE